MTSTDTTADQLIFSLVGWPSNDNYVAGDLQ